MHLVAPDASLLAPSPPLPNVSGIKSVQLFTECVQLFPLFVFRGT